MLQLAKKEFPGKFSLEESRAPRVHTVLKSPWILGEVAEKSLNFCASPWKVLEFSSSLNVVAWKVFFNAFGCLIQCKS